MGNDLGLLVVGCALAFMFYGLWQWQPIAAVALGVVLIYLAGWGVWLILGQGRRAGADTSLGVFAMLLAFLAFAAALAALETGAINAVTDFVFDWK